jgi:hypothetical protein
MNPTRDIIDRRARDARFRPGALDDRHVLPAIPGPSVEVSRSIVAHPGAVKVAAAIATSGTAMVGRPSGVYERVCGREHGDCSCDWLYLPDNVTQYRAFIAAERSRALVATVSRALVGAEASASRLARTVAALAEEQYAR